MPPSTCRDTLSRGTKPGCVAALYNLACERDAFDAAPDDDRRTMKLINELREEHDVIDMVAASFRTYASTTDPDFEDGRHFLRFFRLYAGDYHHAREEHTLFPALVERLSVPADRGPVFVLTDDHRRMAALLARIEELLDGERSVSGQGGAKERETLRRTIADYVDALAHHIDAENSVLLPESEARLGKKGVYDLPSRPPTAEEAAARQAAEELVRRYPPAHDDTIMRGDGCVLCPAMGASCEGLEVEWWNEWEWEEFEDHLPSG